MEEEQATPDDPPGDGPSTYHDFVTYGRSDSRPVSSSSKSIHSTRTLRSTDLEAVSENGRDYPNLSYFMPCDQLEQTRLSIVHQVYLSVLNGALTTAPLPPGVQRILDVGTGPGDWAVAMAQRFLDAEVVAVDLAVWDVEATEMAAGVGGSDSGDVIWEIDDLDLWGPMYPQEDSGLDDVVKGMETLEVAESATLNSQDSGFETNEEPAKTQSAKGKEIALVEPLQPRLEQITVLGHVGITPPLRSPEAGWNFSEPFDFIHFRGMRGAFGDWLGVYREAYKNLVPGGWIEVVDFAVTDPGASVSAAGSETAQLFSMIHACAIKSGYPLNTAHLEVDMFLKAGFDEISVRNEDVPVGLWPEDEMLKRVGKMWLVCMAEMTEAVALRVLTKWKGMDAEEVKERCRKCTEELLSGELGKLETTFTFVRARRPKR